MPALSASRQD
ncbi:uncharacterized protein FFC1_02341 [Fusarium fujikuroi]|nr:uncharacterized protein FFC1_02341 [Fusarium fujikuroi]